MEFVAALATIMLLAFIQNISFSIVSRSRNRTNMTYHAIASVFSNGIWFVTFRQLVLAKMTMALFPGYTIGTVAGSVLGVRISMWIERLLGATSDGHIKPKVDPRVEELEVKVALLEKRLTSPVPVSP
jgi:hypothetical protein